jgi:hypothetical protein
MSEPEAPKTWIEHLSTEAGSFKRIRGTFEFITNAGDFRYGDFLFILADGTHIDCKKVLAFYDTFLALARLEPENVQAFVDELNLSHQNVSNAYRDSYDQYMSEKYPGWKGLDGKGSRGRKAPPEEVKSETINVEDLGL